MALVRGITKANFERMASDFIGMNDGAVHTLSLVDWTMHGEQLQPTVAQWGAWRAYRKAKGLGTAFMDRQVQAGKQWTAPAMWPHEFDAERSVSDDHHAAEMFRRGHRPERIDLADAARRQATVAAYRSRIGDPIGRAA